MDEAILIPSPNWFQANGFVVTNDGWIIYGGPSKSLCVLEPLPSSYKQVMVESRGYKSHVFNRTHSEKIVSIDISSEWPTKQIVLTGSADGSVKQWLFHHEEKILKIKSTHMHDFHSSEREEVTGVGYSNDVYAITVGSFGNVVKWDVNSNVIKNYSFLKNFRPTALSCSKHMLLHVAIGTKQGVVFVLDLNNTGSIVYKVRGHDDEITNLSWCPQYEVEVRKQLKESLTARLDRIRNEPEPNDDSGILNVTPSEKSKAESPENSQLEEDLFDVYQDHASDEFGHKKYEPEEIYVKVKDGEEKADFLDECQKLKQEILKKKEKSEQTIESLVEALDKTHMSGTDKGGEGDGKENEFKSDDDKVENGEPEKENNAKGDGDKVENGKLDESVAGSASVHIHRHLLVTVGKYGGIKIWSKTGKMISSSSSTSSKNKFKNKSNSWVSVLWYKADLILLSDVNSQLLECNPLVVDSKNKVDHTVVHSLHKRGLFAIVSPAPRIQSAESTDDWSIWTCAQDRSIVEYSMKDRKVRSTYMSCGGFVYTAVTCPYDPKRIAVSVGDGAVRVCEFDTCENDLKKLSSSEVISYWQNVQGKVLTVVWHPTKENILAFATAEARVGIINASSKSEKPAKVLPIALTGGVYGLSWGNKSQLYACGGGEIVVYDTDHTDRAPSPIKVSFEGKQWKLSEVVYSERFLIVGSLEGAVALLTHTKPHGVIAAAFPFNKVIHCIDMHPQQVTESNEQSPNRNLVAVCSMEKTNNIVVLRITTDKDDEICMSTHCTLSGHTGNVLRIGWNPHKEAILMSTSHDHTVRIWDVLSSTCISIFGGHSNMSLALCWVGHPSLSDYVMSGGGDCCLRLWNIYEHKAEDYVEPKREVFKKDKKSKKEKEPQAVVENEDEISAAATLESKVKARKNFLLPLMHKQMSAQPVEACRIMLKRRLNQQVEDVEGCDFIKIFGNTNDVNSVIEMELAKHEEWSYNDAWIMLSLIRGYVDAAFQYAEGKDIICPYLLSLAPCVSFKYWKDKTQVYLSQIDRLVAKGEEANLTMSRHYGGVIFRKVATQLSVHDVKGAVEVLTQNRLFKEAYAMCRMRHMDSIAEEVLLEWAKSSNFSGTLITSAVCYIALGDLSQAASALAKSENQEYLQLAAEIAKASGEKTYADHIEEKNQIIKSKKDNLEVELDKLPTKVELLMKELEISDKAEENGVSN